MNNARTFGSSMLVALLTLGGCDDPPPPNQQPAPKRGPRPRPKPAEKPKPEAQLELTEVDFIEGSNNRDPFRSFLAEFKPKTVRRGPVQRKVILPRYGLDELRLIAVVSGRAVRARAMFRDPKGLGVAVKRGDRISKSEARVKRILRDSVVVEVQERSEDRSQVAERVIELHPKEEREKELKEFEGRESESRTPTPTKVEKEGD
jgi:Tfp pilus assembly protein PilP